MRQEATPRRSGGELPGAPRATTVEIDPHHERPRIATIAVGIDLSPGSEHALEHALALARHTGARLLLLHLTPPMVVGPENDATRQYGAILAEEREAAAASLRRLQERCFDAGIPASIEICDGTADHDLASSADQLAVDLLTIGTHGRTGLKRLLLGSVAERAVRQAHAAVLVTRGETVRAAGYHHILVPVDFSPASEAALRFSLELAEPEAQIDVLHCWDLPAAVSNAEMVGVTMMEPLREEARAAAVTRGLDLCRHYEDRGHLVRFIDRMRPPAQGIQEMLEERNYDLVAMGSHGHHGLRRLLLGSVAENTVRHSSCSVLVVKAPATDHEHAPHGGQPPSPGAT